MQPCIILNISPNLALTFHTQNTVQWRMTLTTMATMTPCQMENLSAPQVGLVAQRARQSLMFLAANHFVTRAATSCGQQTKNVIANTQTLGESNKVVVYLAEPIAQVRYD